MLVRPAVPAVPGRGAVAALPRTVRSIAVLDRTKEPGAVGEPLYLDGRGRARRGDGRRRAALRDAPRVIGGRYGLVLEGVHARRWSSADLRGARRRRRPKRHFTVGIYDDVTQPEPADRPAFRMPRPAGEVQAVFFGLGSDGTVGANKASVKIIGEDTDLYAQGYFVYDSRSRARSPCRTCASGRSRSARPTSSRTPTSWPATSSGLLGKADVLEHGPPRRHVPAQLARTGRMRSGSTCRARCSGRSSRRRSTCGSSTPSRVATEVGMGNRINTVMQPCFFQLAGVLPADEAIARIKGFVEKTYGKRGEAVVARNFAAIDRSLAATAPRHAPARRTSEQRRRAADPDRCTRLRQARHRAPHGRSRATCCRSARCPSTAPSRPARRATRSGRSPSRSRSGIRRSASTAASAPWSARTRRSG